MFGRHCRGGLCLVVIVGAGCEPARTEPALTEPARTEPVCTEPARTEPALTEPARTEPASTEPARTEPARTEPARTEAPVQNPPVQNPPVQNPPIQNPSVQNPLLQNPPVLNYPYEITIKDPIRALNDTMRRSGHRAQRVCACQPEITSAGRFFVIARPLPGFHWDCGVIDLAKVVAISSLLIGSSRTERSPRSQASSR